MLAIKPVLRDIYSISWDGRSFSSDDAVILPVDLEISGQGDGVDLFRMEVFNRAWFIEEFSHGAWSWGRARLMLKEFIIDEIRSSVELVIEKHGPYRSWPEFAAKVAPYFIWEFENNSYPPVSRLI